MPEKYRWAHPSDWFSWKLEQWDGHEIFIALQAVALKLDGDQLQDVFEVDMAEDGYFQPTDAFLDSVIAPED